MKGFIADIQEMTLKNSDFRRVLYTGKKLQLVLMTIAPGEAIGEEVHRNVDQFFRIEQGRGEVTIDGRRSEFGSDFAFIVPAGARHNVRNTGAEPLRLYTIYGPPQHADGTVHATRSDALENEEHFVGMTTE
jgi:mannose-6-phosphate isomerase-like protein (cupin superfamily)